MVTRRSPVPIARSDCLLDRAAWRTGHWGIFPDPPLPQCLTSAAAPPWRPDFELESSPSTLAAVIRNSRYPSERGQIRSVPRLVATQYDRSLWVLGQSRDG